MPIAIYRNKVLGDVAYEITRLKKLVADLELIAVGIMPTTDQIEGAPLLDDYRRATRPMLCLVGVCTDHPMLNGPVVMTSDIWVLAPDLGWCRTLGRYYRLGKCRDEGDQS